jgi:uncharacterized protein (TIGR02117 family)
MASQAIPALARVARRSALAALLGGAAMLLLTVVYFALAWVGSAIPRNGAWLEPRSGVTIMVETNGTHAGLVLPIANEYHDWRTVFPSAARPRSDGLLPTHIAIGWGEREVFLDTPTWADLEPATAIRIAVTGGQSLLRVGHYAYPQPSPHHRPLTLRPAEYRRLVTSIERQLAPTRPGRDRPAYRSFERHAVLHDARGRYTLVVTCNQWISNRLAEAGVKTGWWTPLAGGVMRWVPPFEGQRFDYALPR